MGRTKKTWKNIMYVFLLLAAVCILFRWYSLANSRRIENQNLNYAMDSARQTARRIEGEFKNALLRIRNYVYFLDIGLDEPNITAQMLKEMEKNSTFDSIRFISADGISLTSDGTTSPCDDRAYYINGMKGESGSEAVFASRITNKTMMDFYSPVHYNGEIFGMLLGVYFAEDYLQNMLSTSYFGETADVFLCTWDGRTIASSGAKVYEKPLLDTLLEEGVIDTETAQGAWKIFQQEEGEGSFICSSKCTTDNLCVVNIPNSEYVLVQTFPQQITRKMIHNANQAGIILQIILIGLFICYILILLFQAGREKKLLEKENQEMGYVINGVGTLFSRFILADFKEGTYSYLTGTKPEQEDFSVSGKYKDFAVYLSSFLVQEDERQKFLEQLDKDVIIKELGSEGTDLQYEYRMRRDNNKEWEHINIICLEREDKKASKVLFLRQDITKMKEKELSAQEKISLANRRERQYIAATMSDAICTYEINLTRDLINEDILYHSDGKTISLLKQVGLEPPCRASEWFEQWKQFVDIASVEDYNICANVSYLLNCFSHKEGEAVVEYWSDDSTGKSICVRQSFFMTWEDQTNDVVALVIIKEITSQVRNQREQLKTLQEALMQAQHANHAKSTFLSNMSHDIRTPMNAIIGFTTIAVSHIDNKEQVRDCLQKVLSSSNHLLSLINDILDMSRIESGKVQIKEQECNISELTHNLVNIIQPQVKAKKLELFIDTFDVANEDVIADSLKLSQVFVNLLSNAVKYTPSGGMVSFRIIQETTFHRGYGDYVFIVKDNGIGMSSEFVEHIFEPFERESSTTKTGIQGTGLGMAITKNIVEMMGGEISVKSKKGEGSEFRVSLSLKLQDVEKNAAQIKELEGLRAMVVDDDLDSCDSVCKMLRQLGLRAEWTTSGREAVYRARSAYNEGDSYHTYIIDWQMPEMSGIETARRIRQIVANEAPIIVLTAYDWTDIEEEAKQAGVTAFCAKPLFMSDLKSVLLAANNLIDKEEKVLWSQADFSGKRILLVEDNELNREIAESILTETGFVVETAPDGTDAVEMMKQSKEYYYDAVLMDVQMPVMDGYEATKIIRTLPRKDVKNLPIIAMTANAMEEDRETALKSGMNAHIAKPINIDLFIAILRKYLD